VLAFALVGVVHEVGDMLDGGADRSARERGEWLRVVAGLQLGRVWACAAARSRLEDRLGLDGLGLKFTDSLGFLFYFLFSFSPSSEI
jgi:hypothetical protein